MRLTDDQVLRLRFRAQGLYASDARRDVAEVVRRVCALQAQDTFAAALGVRVRSRGRTPNDVQDALDHERSIVRTWAMRGTLHWLAADDVIWLLPLLGPVFQAASGRRRAQLGLDQASVDTGVRLVRDALHAHGPQTRQELVAYLAERGLPLHGQARPHLLHYAALDGVVCFGPERDGEPTYVLLDDWLGRTRRPRKPLAHATALDELARRYLAAYAPARPVDLAAWSGLAVPNVRAAWSRLEAAGELLEVDVAGQSAWLPRQRADWLDDAIAPPQSVRMLPAFDTYLLGYQRRDLAVTPEHARRVNAGGGLLRPALAVDGRILGTWRLDRRRGRPTSLALDPFTPLSPDLERALTPELADLERFLAEPIKRA